MTNTLRIDGPKCPRCHHRELDMTFEPRPGWGLPDGCTQVIHKQCPRCTWREEVNDT